MGQNLRKPRRPVSYIYRAYVTRPDGRRDYARDHGYKAWRIPVYDDTGLNPVDE